MRGIERTGVSDGDTFRSAGISADALKWIALLTMLCDHVGAVLLPQYPILRLIGRTAFPLFVWLLVEGFSHTSSRKKYLGRMAAFAILSELPFDLALYGRPDWQSQNVFVTLSIGLLMLIFLERAMDEWDRRREAGENAFWQAAEACVTLPSHSTRALRREFEEKLTGKVLLKAASTLFLPPPLRAARQGPQGWEPVGTGPARPVEEPGPPEGPGSPQRPESLRPAAPPAGPPGRPARRRSRPAARRTGG